MLFVVLHFVNNGEYQNYNPIVFCGLLAVFNFLAVYFIGGYIMKAVYFPYSNYFITQRLNSQINRRFAEEFSRLMLLMHTSIEIMGGLKQITEYEKEKRDLDDKKIRKKKSRNHNTTVGTLIGWRRTTQHTVSKAIDVKNSNLDSKKISVGNSKKISNTESRWVSIS